MDSVGNEQEFAAQGLKQGGWWHAQNGRIVCDLCPRGCA